MSFYSQIKHVTRAGSLFEIKKDSETPWFTLCWFDWMELDLLTFDSIRNRGVLLKDGAFQEDRSLGLLKLLEQIPGVLDTLVILDAKAMEEVEKSWTDGISLTPTLKMILWLRHATPLRTRMVFWTV